MSRWVFPPHRAVTWECGKCDYVIVVVTVHRSLYQRQLSFAEVISGHFRMSPMLHTG